MKAVWLLAADDDVLWGYRCPHRTKADFSFARVLVDILVAGKTEDNDEGGSCIGANWIGSLSLDFSRRR